MIIKEMTIGTTSGTGIDIAIYLIRICHVSTIETGIEYEILSIIEMIMILYRYVYHA